MKRFLLTGCCLLLAILCAGSSVRIVATSGDPFVTRGYVDNYYKKNVVPAAQANLTSELTAKRNTLLSAITALPGQYAASNYRGLVIQTSTGRVYSAMERLHQLPVASTIQTTMRLPPDYTVSVVMGTVVMLTGGSARLTTAAINLTEGVEQEAGSSLRTNHQYLALSGGSFCAGNGATLRIDGIYRLERTYQPSFTQLATALYAMNLFQGSNNGFELNREATREEGLVMMLRLFGEESAALATTATHPFTDVPSWARRYVAYAYEKGYTQGTSATTFGAGQVCSAEEYITMVLRALGYSESADGFKWYNASSFAQGIGLYNAKEISLVKQTFLRDQMIYLSYYALQGTIKNQRTTLLDALIAKGVCSAKQADAAMSAVTVTRVQ